MSHPAPRHDTLASGDATRGLVRLQSAVHRGQVTHETGVVGARDGSSWQVRTQEGVHRAKQAASCLLAPQPGDLVTVAHTPAGTYVVSVLERAHAGAAATIALDGDLELALGGRFGVTAPAGIELASTQTVAVAAGSVSLCAERAHASIERTTIVGKLLSTRIERIKQVASAIDQVAERLSQSVERCYRFVASCDQLRAETIDHRAEQTLSVHAQNAAITAQKLIKIDGDQIHLG